ncbi:MCE family protein [Sciscionella marina]|uniref:MCE family protein n=1 Tax=Sciscionella marina TaxID=508770 RepID=UPI00036E4D3D|nr:MCE family protein [Sciscionella marina]
MTGVLASVRKKLLGLLLVVLIFAFFALTIAFYNKAFTPVVSVSLRTDTIGSQMQPEADVKAHGTVIGEVTAIKADFGGADLELAIKPEYAKQIPADATAQLLPKSLFGEQYVNLGYAPGDNGPVLADGGRIAQNKSAGAVEVEQALNNFLPVLKAVEPEKLSATLAAVSTALQGRGEQLGQTITQVNEYVKRLNPQLPALTDDISKLVKVSNTYNDVLPVATDALTNLRTTTNTLAQQRGNLDNLYSTVSGTSANLQNFLAANEHNLIGVGKSLRPTLETMQKYAPQVPCFFRSLARLVPKADKAFGKGTDKPGLHANLQINVNRGPYKAGLDTPRYDDTRGPRCYDISPRPDPFPQMPPEGAIKDGASQPPAPRTQSDGMLPPDQAAKLVTTPQSASSDSYGPPNSKAEQDLVTSLTAPALGIPAAQVPRWSTLLIGPLMRGATVDYPGAGAK